MSVGYHLNRPLRIVFAYEGAKWSTLMKSIKKNGWDDLFDLICIVNAGVFLRRGRLFEFYDKKSGAAQKDDDFIINKDIAALALLYFYLVQYGSSFSAGNIFLEEYFKPLDKWGKSEKVDWK